MHDDWHLSVLGPLRLLIGRPWFSSLSALTSHAALSSPGSCRLPMVFWWFSYVLSTFAIPTNPKPASRVTLRARLELHRARRNEHRRNGVFPVRNLPSTAIGFKLPPPWGATSRSMGGGWEPNPNPTDAHKGTLVTARCCTFRPRPSDGSAADGRGRTFTRHRTKTGTGAAGKHR